MYVFIPDSGMVGTVFVNCVANLLTTAATAVSVSIESTGAISTPCGTLEQTKFGAAGAIGALQFGQTRDVYLDVPIGANQLFAKVEFRANGRTLSVTADAQLTDNAQQKALIMRTRPGPGSAPA